MPLQAGVKRKYKNNDEKYYTKSVNDSAKNTSKKMPKKSKVDKPSQQKKPANAYTDTATKAAQTIKKNVEGKKTSSLPKYNAKGIAKANTGNTAKPQTAKQKWVSDRNAYKRTDSDKVTYKVGDDGAKGGRRTVSVAEYPPNKKKAFGERKPTATGYSKASKGVVSTGVGGKREIETDRYNNRKVDAGSRDMQYRALSGMLNADEPTRRITDVHGRTAVDDRFRVNNLDDWFNVGGKLMSNTYDSLADNSLVGAAYSYGTGNKLSDDFNVDNPYNEQRTQGATAMAGRMIGLAGNYMMGRAALAPQLERASEAVMNGTKVGKMLQGSSKLGKIGQNIGLTGRELGKELVTETIADSTIGLAQNALLNYGEGLRGGDLLKQTAKDLALDIGVGGVMEGVGLYGKVVRKPNEILSQNIKEGLTPETTKKEYIQGLLNRAHDNIELRSGSDVSQKLSDAIMTKNTEILDEIHKVEAMDGQQFNRYKIGRDINGDYYDVRRGREGVISVKRNEAEVPEASKAETPAKAEAPEKPKADTEVATKSKPIEVPSEKEEQILTDYQELSMSNEASVENVVKYSDGEYTAEEVESVLRKNGLLKDEPKAETSKAETPRRSKKQDTRPPSDRMAYKTLLAMPDSEAKWKALKKKFDRDVQSELADGVNASNYIADYEGYRAAESEVWRLEKKYEPKPEAPKKNVGYHAGDLGKAEWHHQQSADRDTGFLGTGTYFVGDKALVGEGTSYADRPLHEVDFNDYPDMYRPKDYAQGKRVYDNLKEINHASRNLSQLIKRIDSTGESLSAMRKVVEEAGEYTETNLKKLQDIGDDVLSSKEISDLEDEARKRATPKTRTDGEYLELAKRELKDEERVLKATGLSRTAEEDAIRLKEIEEDLRNTDKAPKSYEEYYFNLLSNKLSKELEPDSVTQTTAYLDSVERAKNIIPQLSEDLGRSEADVRKALDTAVEKISKYKPNSKEDSASTIVMKELGFEGVNVKGIEGLDNVEYGSVIYDLKESANGRKNTQLIQEGNLQQGTAKGNSGSESVLQGDRPRNAGDIRVESERRSRASGNLQIPEGDVVDEATDKILRTDRQIPKRTAKKADDIEAFSKQLDENRATNEYGCCVSPVDPKTYVKDTRYFTTHEGQVTGGVEKNGNITALSKSANAPKGVNSHEALMTAFGMGGDRADAFGIRLAQKYQRYGLIPVARVPFDENVVRENFRPNEVESSLATFKKMKDVGNDPDIYFFAKFDDLENTIKTRNNGGYRILSEEELRKLPEMDYDSAEKFRNSLLDDADKKAAYMKEHAISDTFTEPKVAEAKPARKPIKRLSKKAETVAAEAKAEAKAEVKPAKTTEADLPQGGKLEKVGEFEVVGGGKGVDTTTPTETNLPFIERFKRTIRNARRDLINSEAGVERMDKVAGQTKIQEKSYMARNAKGQTGYILDKGLVNRKGEKIGESLSKVLGGDFKFEDKVYKSPYRDAKTGKLFDEYAMELHNTYRAKQGKSIYGGRDYAEEVDQIIKNYPALADEKDRLLKWLNDTDGTTSKEQRKALEERLRNKYSYEVEGKDGKKEIKSSFDDVIKDLNEYRAAKSQARVNEILDKHPEFKQVTKNMDDWWNKFTDEYLAGSGILSADDVKKFKELYPHYVPTFRDMGEAAGRETKNAANLIKRATGSGKRTLLTVPEQYAHQIDRIVTAARKNELYQEIINTLSKDPAGMKAFGAVLDNKGKMVYDFSSGDIDEFITSLDEISLNQIKGGKNTITAVFGGQTVKANVSDEVAKSLEAMNNLMNTNLITKIGKTITNPMKFTITGGNPVFFVSNMMRDLPTLYIQSNHGMLRTTIGLAKATKEVFTNGEKYQMYKALGGAESGYYMRGKGWETSMSSKGAVKKLQGIVSFLGEKGEAIPRMAEFINTLEKTGDSYKALRDAAESTVDFSRKGSSDVAQALDAWTLYLNAGVQGLDKFARTVAEHPLRTAGRSATMLGIPFLALTALNYDNPHYQDLTERVKQNNFLIPNLQGEKDENGYCTTFIKVPLNREYGTVFAASLYCALKGVRGEDDSWEGFSETFKENFLPNNPITDNVLAPLLINIPQNKDFAGRSIIPSALKDASPENQYDYDTSEFAKLVASGMNKIPVKDVPILKYLQSPKLVDYILDSYSGYYGQALKSATTTGGTSMDNYVKDVLLKQTAEQPFINKFRADARYSSKPVSDLYDLKDEYAKKKTDAEMSGKTWSEAHAAEAALSKISKGIYESTQAEKAILEDKSLTKAEKDKLIGELRTARNELAKQAPKEIEAAIKEYKEAPAFSALNEKTKEKWNKGLKINKQDWALAYGDIVDSYDERKDATGSGTTAEEKRYILMQHGITSYKVAQSILGENTSKDKWDEAVKDYKKLRPQYSSDEAFRKAIAQQSIDQRAKEKEIEEITKNMSKSEKSFYKYYRTRADDRYNKSKNVSKTVSKDLYDAFIYESQYVDKHTDNNGSITQPEARNIIENLDKMYGLSQAQKACFWYLAENDGGWKKKPYGNYKP